MDQRAGLVSFFDRRLDVFVLAAAHHFHEILEVVVAVFHVLLGPGFVRRSKIGLIGVVIRNRQIALGAVILVGDGVVLARATRRTGFVGGGRTRRALGVGHFAIRPNVRFLLADGADFVVGEPVANFEDQHLLFAVLLKLEGSG